MDLLLRTILIFVFGATMGLQAADLRVEEVGIVIHEKPVTGYQIELEGSLQEVKSGVLSHLQAYSAEVFAYEGLLIFENIEYPPITTSRSITLYYRMEDREGILTRLVLVGMYDYRNSINSTEFPDLTLRMLLDLGVLVKSMSKAEIDFSHIFNGKRPEEIRSRYQDRMARDKREMLISRSPERIGLGDDILIKNDPFSATIEKTRGEETEEEIVAEISRRFGTYMEGKSDKTPFITNEKFEQTEAYRDTITLLREELAQTQEILSRTEKALSQTHEDMSTLAERLNDQENALAEYRDTIRILKDGVYGYGLLLEEQQAFIDTLLESIAETPKESRKNYNSIKIDKPSAESSDSINELLDIQYANKRLMGRQQASIDSLRSEVLFLKDNLPSQQSIQVEDQRARHKSALDSLAIAVRDLKLAMKDIKSNVMHPVVETNHLNRQISILKEKNVQFADSLNLQKNHIHSLRVDNERLMARLRASSKDYLSQRDYAETLVQKTREQEQQIISAGQAVEKARQEVERARKANEKYLKTQESQLRVYIRAVARADSFKVMATRYKQDYHQLAAVNDSLKLEIDLLDPFTESAKARRRVYQEQVDNLTQLEKRLPVWENEVKAREKLLKQREKYLTEFQKTGDLTTLLDRIKDLEEEIMRLNEILK